MLRGSIQVILQLGLILNENRFTVKYLNRIFMNVLKDYNKEIFINRSKSLY